MTTIFLWSLDLRSITASQHRIQDVDWLSDDEISRARAYRFNETRRRFVAGRQFLRKTLALHLDCEPSDVEFELSATGKPSISGRFDSSLRFSFSRSDDYVACGITDGAEIGVDIECRKRLDDLNGLAKTIFNSDDYSTWRRLSEADQSHCFYRVWTRKEATGKAIGDGISNGPKNIVVPINAVPAGQCMVTTVQPSRQLVLCDHQPFQDIAGSVAYMSGAGPNGNLVYRDAEFDPGGQVRLAEGRTIAVPDLNRLTILRFEKTV